MAAFNDAEVEQAARTLDQAEAMALRDPSSLTPNEVQVLYQSRGLVLLVQGDTTGAMQNISKALEADPTAKPLDSLGGEYAKVHKSLQKSGMFR